jgi:hypothetical protein
MTPHEQLTSSLVRALIAAMRAEGWVVTPPPRANPSRPSPFWTHDQTEIVRSMWEDKSIPTADIVRRVGKSLAAVKHKAANLGVHRKVGRPRSATSGSSPSNGVEKSDSTAALTPDPTIAAEIEMVSTVVAPRGPAAKMADRDPIPAPRRGARGGVDRTGELMGDPGHRNRREAESEYHRRGSELA